MGTAGHVDHGKTSIVKALTGIDCDTHKEEKKRGITINLGFASYKISETESLGIIDVPGHRDFVHTMVGGISGIDFVTLVIAADSGIMPQTREHLNIMKLLGVKSGLIALNKIDLVQDPDLLDLVIEEIREYIKGSFLESAPIVPLSVVTGEGMDRLQSAINQVYSAVTPRKTDGRFRLYIDRIFTVKGHGTVVTGSVINGSLVSGGSVYLLPGEKQLRVKQMERYGQPVETIVAGDRASINLAGLERNDFERGMLLADQKFETTSMIDAQISIFEESLPLPLWSQVIFHCGTYESQAHIHLIDKDKLEAGGSALVQIKLLKQAVFMYGDRFVIRNSSSDKTLGGGKVIDAYPFHHRRRTTKVILSMQQFASGKLSELITAQLSKTTRALWANEIAGYLGFSEKEIIHIAEEKEFEQVHIIDISSHEGSKEKTVTVESTKSSYALIQTSLYEKYKKRVINMVEGYHKKNPLSEKGMTIQQFATGLSIEESSATWFVLQSILNRLLQDKVLQKVMHTYAAFDHKVVLSSEMKHATHFIENRLKNSGMQTPLLTEIIPDAKRQAINEPVVYEVLRYLVSQEKVYFVDDSYIHSTTVDLCRQKLRTWLESHPEGITIAQFRDLVGGNRKICLLLINQYDSEGLTIRHGDVRRLKS
jgi:selenocysteine-specific elongation factor